MDNTDLQGEESLEAFQKRAGTQKVKDDKKEKEMKEMKIRK